jgi:hypothetical protein
MDMGFITEILKNYGVAGVLLLLFVFLLLKGEISFRYPRPRAKK